MPADLAFFPLETGDYWVYQVTEQDYSLTAAPVVRRFQVQDKVVDVFSRNGQPVYQLDRSVRPSAQAEWQTTGVRTVAATAAEVVVQEGNVPTVPLRFPVATGTFWNKNAYNNRPDSVLRYRDIGRTITVGNRLVAGTVAVVGANDSTLIGLYKRRWVYAPGVGLVYREEANLAYCQSLPACIGKAEITSGTRQTWALLASNRWP